MPDLLKPAYVLFMIVMYCYKAIVSYADTPEGAAALASIETELNVDINNDGNVGGAAESTTETRTPRGRPAQTFRSAKSTPAASTDASSTGG